MPAERTTALGRLTVTDEVIATVAARRALSCPAVAGLARPTAGSAPLPPHRLARAVTVSWVNGEPRLLVHVQVRHGTSARALVDTAARVRETVGAALGGPARVELKVVGLRGRLPEAAEPPRPAAP